MEEVNKDTELNDTDKKLHISDVIQRFFGIRKKLTYEERVQWFVNNFYETGMEYQIMLDNMKNDDLDNFKWYDDFIKIPKYKDEL
jgi:hypothetical protein